jgi:hypothetical protein
MPPRTVYVLAITTRHWDDIVSAHMTKAGRDAAIRSFAASCDLDDDQPVAALVEQITDKGHTVVVHDCELEESR